MINFASLVKVSLCAARVYIFTQTVFVCPAVVLLHCQCSKTTAFEVRRASSYCWLANLRAGSQTRTQPEGSRQSDADKRYN